MSKLSSWKTISLLCVFCAVEAIASPAQTFTTFDAPGADSYTKVTATVPSGAKTGKIGVITPGGTATSAGTFTVN